MLEGICPECGSEANVLHKCIVCTNRNCKHFRGTDWHVLPEPISDFSTDLSGYHKRGLHNLSVRGPEMEVGTKE